MMGCNQRLFSKIRYLQKKIEKINFIFSMVDFIIYLYVVYVYGSFHEVGQKSNNVPPPVYVKILLGPEKSDECVVFMDV